MKVNFQNNSFTSKNPTIRFADDIARKTNNLFPRVSYSRVCSSDFISKKPYAKFNLRENTRAMRNAKSGLFYNADNFLEKINAFLKPIKDYKVGNCAESAQLSAIVAKVNGINDCKIVRLFFEDGKSIDHEVLYVAGKKPYLIDAWLNVADYADNMIERYKGEFSKYFSECDLKSKKIKLIYKKSDDYDFFLSSQFGDEEIKALRQLYPEFVIKK